MDSEPSGGESRAASAIAANSCITPVSVLGAGGDEEDTKTIGVAREDAELEPVKAAAPVESLFVATDESCEECGYDDRT